MKAIPAQQSHSAAPADKKGEVKAEVKETKAEAPKEKVLDGRQVFDIALKNVSPIMELKSRRIGGANYQVPMEVMDPRKTTLGMRWLLAAAKGKKGAPMAEKLAEEIMLAANHLKHHSLLLQENISNCHHQLNFHKSEYLNTYQIPKYNRCHRRPHNSYRAYTMLCQIFSYHTFVIRSCEQQLNLLFLKLYP